MKHCTFLLGMLLVTTVLWATPIVTDTLVIPEDIAESDSNYSAITVQKGYYRIGDTVIHLSAFKTYDQPFSWDSISFSKNLLAIARININGMYAYSYDATADTQMLRGRKQQLSPSVKKQRYRWMEQTIGFSNSCPPGSCYHYYAAKHRTKGLVSATDRATLQQWIPIVKRPADALFLLKDTWMHIARFQRTKHGFFILINERIRDCKMTFADVLYFIDVKGNIKTIGSNVTYISKACI